MAAKIDYIISAQGFELVRDRIGEILIEELANQFVLSADPDINCGISVERSTPYDKTELPVVNVSLFNGSFGKKEARVTEGVYQYNLDCFHSSKTKDQVGGDTISSKKLQKLMGLVRFIFENQVYKTLGYEPGFIGGVWFTELGISEIKEKDDALSTCMGRLILNVKLGETNTLLTPKLLAGYETTVKINQTENGYYWKYGY